MGGKAWKAIGWTFSLLHSSWPIRFVTPRQGTAAGSLVGGVILTGCHRPLSAKDADWSRGSWKIRTDWKHCTLKVGTMGELYFFIVEIWAFQPPWKVGSWLNCPAFSQNIIFLSSANVKQSPCAVRGPAPLCVPSPDSLLAKSRATALQVELRFSQHILRILTNKTPPKKGVWYCANTDVNWQK